MQNPDLSEEDFKVMSLRIKHANWQVRKKAYQQILENLQEVTSLKQQFKINTEIFTALKLTSTLNNLTEEKHPTLVLKGLECVLTIIALNHNAIKYFNQLVSEGLQKFPLLTQQRKHILQKFMELLYFFKDQQHIVATLSSKLALPNQKAVMWVIEVIGALEINALRPKLVEISKKHPKLDVKELAAEIAGQLEGEEIIPVRKQEVKAKATVARPVATRKEEPRRVTQLLEKLHHYQQMPSKEQQRFSQELVQAADNLCELPMSPQLTNFSYFIQLMIEDNNQIISTNGVKILRILIDSRSQLLPTSYPLLFIFRKFKLHKTHATNLNLLKSIQALICSNRSHDLMSAIHEGMGGIENKANIKYGCIVSFLRIFCYFYGEEKLFKSYCIGEYRDLGEKIENKKHVEKMLIRCAETFVREKDKQYIPAIDRVKEVMGMKPSSLTEQKSTKSISDSRVPITRKSNMDSTKTQPIPKLASTTKSTKSKSALIVSVQGQLNKILELTKSSKCSSANLQKAMDKCFKCLSECIQDQIYDMFFYCEILDSVIDSYEPDERWDEMISEFMIDYLKIVSGMEFKESKRKSKIVKNGVDYLLQIGITKLALGKELLFILGKLHQSVGFDVIFKSLGDVLVMQGEICKKKNKKYLNRWLQEHISQEYLDNQFEQLKEAIEKKKKVEQPPSIINIPSYQELKAPEQKIEDRPIFKKKLDEKYKREEAEELRRLEYERLRQEAEEQLRKHQEHQQAEYRQNIRQREQHQEQLRPPRTCEKLDMFQNADISHIEKIQQPETDRLDQKWEYFLNKKGVNLNPLDHQEDTFKIDREQHGQEEQKYNYSEQHTSVEPQSMHTYKFDKHEQEEPYDMEIQTRIAAKEEQRVPTFRKHHQSEQSEKQEEQEPSFKIQQDKFSLQESQIKHAEQTDSGIKRYYQPEDQDQQYNEPEEQHNEQFKYVYLDAQRIIYMLTNSGKSFSHLRTLVFNPFRKNTNKHAFLRELTHLIQHQKINKPEPFKSLLLLVIILFTEIRNDKSVIGPLQFLYEYMAQMCTNNEFLKIIIGLYHCVIEQSEQSDRKMLLTILNKSIVRIMPYVQNAWEMLKDFQQFYQIGELVYFQMYAEEYMQIRETLQGCDSLQIVIGKACQQQGQNIMPMVEGWLDTNFKKVVKKQLEAWLESEQGQNDR